MKQLFLFLFILPVAALAQIPSGYYNSAAGLNGVQLQQALHNIIDNHTVLTYTPGVWDAYYSTDRKPGTNKVWTIYSDRPGSSSPYEFVLGDQCGSNSPSSEGNCYNREHVWPRAYFGGQVPPMNTDLWIVYPTDYWVNSKRGNLPYGRVLSPTWTSQNGSKVGPQTFAGAPTNTAFEPIDSFKGDIARSYFYVATRYLGEDNSWDDWDMANKAVLKPWAAQMLIQWHQLDPVSTKEKLRNDSVYKIQGNRNPFIDHPQFVECIWGSTNCSGLSVKNSDEEGSFVLAPNPARTTIQITIPLTAQAEGVLELMDIQGRIQLRQIINKARESVDVQDLPRGVYILRVRTATDAAARQIVLQ